MMLQFKFVIYFAIVVLGITQVVVSVRKKKKIQEKYDEVNERLWGDKNGYRRCTNSLIESMYK